MSIPCSYALAVLRRSHGAIFRDRLPDAIEGAVELLEQLAHLGLAEHDRQAYTPVTR